MGYDVDLILLDDNVCETLDEVMAVAEALRVPLRQEQLRLVHTSIVRTQGTASLADVR